MIIGFSGKAQYNTVEKIRAYYTKINQTISSAIKEKIGEYCNEITVNSTKASWPAVGNYQKRISIWYSDDPESHGDGKPLQFLDKVNVSVESAANKSSEEYLFANGELIFCVYFDFYEYNGITEKDECRICFNKGKVLKYDLKQSGHNQYSRSKEEVQANATHYGTFIKQLFLNSCEYSDD